MYGPVVAAEDEEGDIAHVTTTHVAFVVRLDTGLMSARTGKRIHRSMELLARTSFQLYVPAKFCGQLIRCMLDSGCEHNVIGRRCIPGVRLCKASYTVHAIHSQHDHLADRRGR